MSFAKSFKRTLLAGVAASGVTPVKLAAGKRSYYTYHQNAGYTESPNGASAGDPGR